MCVIVCNDEPHTECVRLFIHLSVLEAVTAVSRVILACSDFGWTLHAQVETAAHCLTLNIVPI